MNYCAKKKKEGLNAKMEKSNDKSYGDELTITQREKEKFSAKKKKTVFKERRGTLFLGRLRILLSLVRPP